MADLNYSEFKAILKFLTTGQVAVPKENLGDFLETSKELQITAVSIKTDKNSILNEDDFVFEAERQNKIEINFLQNSWGHKPDVSKNEDALVVWLIKR